MPALNDSNNDPCGYCGTSEDPNDMCLTCYTNLHSNVNKCPNCDCNTVINGLCIVCDYGCATCHITHPEAHTNNTKLCYECDKLVAYLFDDGRGNCCTRLTHEEIEGVVS